MAVGSYVRYRKKHDAVCGRMCEICEENVAYSEKSYSMRHDLKDLWAAIEVLQMEFFQLRRLTSRASVSSDIEVWGSSSAACVECRFHTY